MMKKTPPEVAIAFMASLVFWGLLVAIILVVGQKWSRLKGFRERMLLQWQPSLGVTLLYLVGMTLRGPVESNFRGLALGSVMTFCQGLIGLTLARSIAGYEPLPVARAMLKRDRPWRSLLLMVGVALLAVVAGMIAGMVGTGAARALGEIKQPSQGEGMFVPALWQLFFYFLTGAGIAEETLYRLVLVSFVWLWTGHRWPAILFSGLLFGAYHLTPLSGMYLTFWQYPLTQFFSSTLIGMVWAYIYTRRGYETAVLAHTLSDWLPVAVFVLFIGGGM